MEEPIVIFLVHLQKTHSCPSNLEVHGAGVGAGASARNTMNRECIKKILIYGFMDLNMKAIKL